MSMRGRARFWILIGTIALAGACTETEGSSGSIAGGPESPEAVAPDRSAAERLQAVPPGPERSQAELVAAGRSVYNANCIACHSVDPTRDGALGPAVAGASYELIEARVLRGGYPEGYEPKRETRVMVALPHLEPRLDELAAYLESFPLGSS